VCVCESLASLFLIRFRFWPASFGLPTATHLVEQTLVG